ncbi:transcription elongation factor A protein 1-like isoform X2 [Dreissena polymorpha]|uniref:transcription elongation factor A protein 1-like isoform X2 n=1 Tax=Dreissena polymorpha TaxID=45954 RepID=UPI0022656777|nr:transcription elongation factor A protein 1-like isoform X2 [Dreissena polymorpha]
MPTEDEVLKIRSKLEKMISSKTTEQSSAVDLLKKLQDLPMNLDVLQKTRIGITVNNFRRACKTEEVISLSKNLIKIWKKLLPADSSSKPDKKEKASSKNGDSTDGKEDSEKTDDSSGRRLSTLASDTNDPVRLKCRELLSSALKTDGSKPGHLDPDELAAAIEDNIFQEFKNTEIKYKNRVRSRLANLKDVKNPDLRANVLCGLIPADRISKMTAEEMASSEMKNLRAKYTKEAIDDHQMAKTGGTTTDLFKCGKCGKSNCTYNQLQTRSSDEPMTTFVFCNECGNRWKEK